MNSRVCDSHEIIFLNQEWLGFKGLGWLDFEYGNDFRVLTKEQWFRNEIIILDNTCDGAFVQEVLPNIPLRRFIPTRVIYHSFKGVRNKYLEEILIAFEGLKALKEQSVSSQNAIIYCETFLVAVQRPYSDYIDSLSKELRRKLNKARKSLVSIRSNVERSGSFLSWFAVNYAQFARSRGISFPSKSYLEYLSKNNNLVGFVVESSKGEIMCSAVVGIASSNAIFLYGFSPAATVNGESHFMQTEIVRALRGQGVESYDLCGFPSSSDHEDGLFRFKKGLGGDLVSFGNEKHFEDCSYTEGSNLVRSFRRKITNAFC